MLLIILIIFVDSENLASVPKDPARDPRESKNAAESVILFDVDARTVLMKLVYYLLFVSLKWPRVQSVTCGKCTIYCYGILYFMLMSLSLILWFDVTFIICKVSYAVDMIYYCKLFANCI